MAVVRKRQDPIVQPAMDGPPRDGPDGGFCRGQVVGGNFRVEYFFLRHEARRHFARRPIRRLLRSLHRP
jgi:hypothetical protein